MACFFFFFKGIGNLRALHELTPSCPPRRSSDLPAYDEGVNVLRLLPQQSLPAGLGDTELRIFHGVPARVRDHLTVNANGEKLLVEVPVNELPHAASSCGTVMKPMSSRDRKSTRLNSSH